MLLGVYGQAAEVVQRTDTVQGRAPVVSNVVIGNQSYPDFVGARVGHVLSISSAFADADGDTEAGSTIQWLRNGAAISGATGETYTVQSADAGRSLSVQVTPKTDPAITSPASGMVATSAAIAVTAGIMGYGNFLAPDALLRNWSQADSFCKSKGARLPTRDELQQLFVDATSSPAWAPNSGYIQNTEMCSLYGWPLAGMCGGGEKGHYWSSTSPSSGRHSLVAMTTGGVMNDLDSFTYLVACVR